MQKPLLLNPEQAAQELGIGRTRTFALIASGELESVKIGRARRIPRAALEVYVGRLLAQQNGGAAA
ncbi:MAG: helix-turn-helix domain-containing protein [Streptosporangiales bacterium]|nr:helix-turn-helix domain-containing protein [Streptosporangiales bacterium]